MSLPNLLNPKRLGLRPLTRLGAGVNLTHVFYELGAGVGMPLASRIGVRKALAGWSMAGLLMLRLTEMPNSRDRAFAVLNGMFLSANIAHFVGWPRTYRYGIVVLKECEGLSGRAMVPYNAVLHISTLASIGALAKVAPRNRVIGIVVALAPVPFLVREQHVEYAQLKEQSRTRPAWWNRRLQGQR